MANKTKSVIILGPLFTQAERIWNRLLKIALEKESGWQLKITLPQDSDGKYTKENGEIDFDTLYKDCLKNAESHDIAVAILDGPDSDSGTCIEIGWRKGRNPKLTVIGVRTDFRSSEDKGLNAMLRICDGIIFFPSFNEDLTQLAKRIIEEIGLKKR